MVSCFAKENRIKILILIIILNCVAVHDKIKTLLFAYIEYIMMFHYLLLNVNKITHPMTKIVPHPLFTVKPIETKA